jgi:5'-nucleotidase
MRKYLIIALVAMGFCACAPKQLTLLHLNDTHSHNDPLRSGEAGVIERAAYIDSVRRADGLDNVLLLHAGDFSQGTSYFTIMKGDLETSLINALGYDCITLGNHEFDNGIEELGRRLAMTQCPVVLANYDFSPFEAGKYIKPYTIVNKAGMKIGIIGILCDISSVVSKSVADRIPHLGNDIDILNKWAEYLKNTEKCDLVIALTHVGYQGEPGINDVDLAKGSRNVDLIVGGHSHTFLEKMEGEYNADGKFVPIVQDGCWGYYVGKIKIRKK